MVLQLFKKIFMSKQGTESKKTVSISFLTVSIFDHKFSCSLTYNLLLLRYRIKNRSNFSNRLPYTRGNKPRKAILGDIGTPDLRFEHEKIWQHRSGMPLVNRRFSHTLRPKRISWQLNHFNRWFEKINADLTFTCRLSWEFITRTKIIGN